MPALHDRLQARLEEDALDVPLLPEVVHELLALTAGEDCDPHRLATLVRRDPAIAGHVLRIANSPLYMPAVSIVSLQQAITRLGLEAIRQIALLITCQARVFHVPGYEAQVRGLFQHCLAAALFAQEIARLRRVSVEDAFLGGLLHDVGRPLLLQAALDLWQGEPPGLAAALDALHTRAAGALVRRWSLPERLAHAIAFHHQPLSAPAAALPAAALLALADDLAHHLCGPREVPAEACRAHPALMALHLYPAEVDALLSQKDAVARKLEAML